MAKQARRSGDHTFNEDSELLRGRKLVEVVTHDVSDAVFVKDRKGRYVLANAATCAIIGRPAEEVLGRDDTAFFPPEIAAALQHDDASVLADGETKTIQESFVVDGRTRTLESIKGPIRNAEGTIIGLYGIARDITNAAAIASALRESEQRYRTLIEWMPAPLVVHREGRCLFANPAAMALLELESLDDFVGTPVARWLSVEDRDEIARRGEEALAQGIGATTSARVGTLITSSGARRQIEGQGVAVLYDGTPAVVTMMRDLTDDLARDAALRANEELFRASQRAANIGSYRCDFVKGVFICSEVLDEIFGYAERAEHPIADWVSLIHPDDRAMMTSYLEMEVLGRGVRFDRLYRIVRTGDGAMRWVHGLGDLEVVDGRVVSMTGTIQDVTAHHEASLERDAIREQLLQAQKMESVGRLAGGVAHDFNNMLGVILANVEMAIDQVPPGDPLRTDLDEVRRAALRSVELTRQLLAFARKQTASPQVLDLNDTVAGMLRMLQRLIGEDIAIDWRPSPERWRVRIDPSQVDQILANLCVNARDAMTSSGRLTIETAARTFTAGEVLGRADAAPGDYVVLAVSDTGHGMDAEVQSHLFEPFFTTKSLGKGTGLGLPTVWGIVRQNGGFIEVDSAPGQGSTFRIHLPRFTMAGSPSVSDAAPEPSHGGHEVILLVEDEPGILTLAARMLGRQGYHVLRAGTPTDAIQVAREHVGDIHLLLTDVIMPEMNGRDLADRLTALRPGLRRMYMSGYPADVIAHHGVLDSGVHFLQKPFTQEQLLHRVRVALDDSKQ